MTRIPGLWRTRLFAYIAECEYRKFELGKWDCAIFTAGAIEAMTGTDLASEYRGKYSSFGEGAALLGCNPLAFLQRHFKKIKPVQSLVGDIAAVQTDDGIATGIVGGDHIRLVAEKGMIALPFLSARIAFRV